MNNLSFIAVAAAIVLNAAGCQSPDANNNKGSVPDSTYTLSGKIQGVDSGWVNLLHRGSDPLSKDSAILRNGEFSLKGKLPAPEYCTITVHSGGEQKAAFDLFLQSGSITLSGRLDSLTATGVTIKGSPTQDEYRQFLEKEKYFDSAFRSLGSVYEAAEAKKNGQQLDSVKTEMRLLGNRHGQAVKDYALSHPKSYVAAFEAYSNFSYDPDEAGKLDTIYTGMDSSIQASHFGKKIRETIASAKKTAIGQPAPLFEQNDVAGKPVSLASFKGKVVLVDFWASWCGPCRAENPAVLKAYKKYHPKGFTILGVSLDSKKDKWEEAIKQDKLDWTQVSDLQGWKNSVAIQYGVKGIPINYLLDKNGIIVARGLRGEELEKQLAVHVK